MSDQMEQKMERTIQVLQASMPRSKNKHAPIIDLWKIAMSEMSAPYLILLFVGVLGFGLISSRIFSMPLLTVFCTAPMPMLLLFHRYILSRNERMRELEETLRYSYSEMVIARTTVISCYMAVSLVLLSAVLHRFTGENFIRLALCGAVPSLYLCALMILISSRCRNQEGISLAAISVWAALCFSALLLPFNDFLQICSTMLYAALVAIGVVIYGICLYKARTRRAENAIHTG